MITNDTSILPKNLHQNRANWLSQNQLALIFGMMDFCCQIVATRGSDRPEALISCGFQDSRPYSHSTNPIIWGCISYTLTGITFANLLIFYLLFLAVNFLSIKIVSQKAGEYNYLLHRFPGFSAIENTLIYRKFSFIALDAFRSGRSRHPWTL